MQARRIPCGRGRGIFQTFFKVITSSSVFFMAVFLPVFFSFEAISVLYSAWSVPLDIHLPVPFHQKTLTLFIN